MRWIDDILDQLTDEKSWGYRPGSEPAAEPTALAALALLGHGRRDQARALCDALVTMQSSDGGVGVSRTEKTPQWPTSLAVLAWRSFDQSDSSEKPQPRFTHPCDEALRWILEAEGERVARSEEIGHDTMLLGWSWAVKTHSWVEPTCWFVMALKKLDHNQHERTREAVRLLQDRLFVQGGCNYGNTIVLGQTLRPHLLPSGLALLALRGEVDHEQRIEKTVRFTESTLSPTTPALSLAYAVLGLAAHGRFDAQWIDWLEQAARRNTTWGASQHRKSMLALAALGTKSPVIGS